ncbi:MAG TPA: ABC transporter permease [Longimicrobiales bacterium]|nr:ABC transporter permease [Longimicrobiales bacterium]
MKERWPFRRMLGPGGLGQDDKEIREELELYLELRTEELMEGGLSREEARREAEARFGNPQEIERRLRREAGRTRGRGGGRTMVNAIRQDIRYALRTFRRNPGFTLVAALTLGIAVAGNTAIFSVLDEAVFQALPFPEADRLVFINGVHVTEGGVGVRMASVPEFRDWQEGSQNVDPMVAVQGASLTLGGDGPAERVDAELVSEGYFELLGGRAELGRTFTPQEAATPDGHPLAVISRGLWQRRFGGEPDIVGRTLELNDRSFTILGVMPDNFQGVGLGVDAWIPLGMISVVASVETLDARGSRFLPVVGRLAAGASVEQAQAELDGIARELQRLHPDSHEDRFAQVRGFREGYLGTTGRLLWILFAAGILLLLVAASNVANLLLVRSHARTRELTVRRALGAEGGRVAGQLLTESVVLALLGGAVGLPLAAWGISALMPLLPEGVLPAWVEPAISARVFLFTLVVLALVGIGAGLLPAVASARRDLASSLKAGGRGTAGGGARARRVFVVAQVALALLLLVGAGLLTRSFRAQLQVDPGLDMAGVYVFRVSPPNERYPDDASLRLFADELILRVEAVPGVGSVAASSDFPFRGRSSGSYIVRPDAVEDLIRYHRHSVTPGYFENLGVGLLAGRTFTPTDDEAAPGVAVVTAAMVERVFPELPDPESAVGETIFIGNPSNPDNLAEIVGVVENVRFRNLTQDMMAEPNSPDVFFSIRQVGTRTHEISFRSDRPLAELLPGLREAVAAVDPDVPMFFPAALEEGYRAQTAIPRFAALLMTVLSGLAMVLACVGVYGVLAFTVGERAKEIAVRRALGARSAVVARSVVWSGLRLAGVGLLLGGGAALLGGRLLGDFLFQVPASDPVTFLGVAGVLLLVVLAAAAVPAWRATLQEPVEALTSE